MKKLYIITSLLVALLLIPLITYLIFFWNYSVSEETQIWGSFGDYLNGTFMPIIALLGILVTYYLGIISEKRNQSNIKIEQIKHRPILHIGYFDAEDYQRIFIENKGNGPLIIKDYKLIREDSSEENRIFDCLPELLNDDYDNYTGNIKDIVMKPNEQFELFLYKCDMFNTESIENKRRIRESLSQYKISIKYQDVYENKMPVAERSLIWFGRNIQLLSNSQTN